MNNDSGVRAGGLGFWRGLWQEQSTPWDQHGPHARLEELLREASEYRLLAPGARIVEPGCGRAHNGAALARRGFVVTAFDAADEAVAEAKKLYGNEPGLTIEVGDALQVKDEWRGKFDAVFDRAMLCALPETLRRPYLAACFECLKPGGVFLSLPFTKFDPAPAEGPPFALTMNELSNLLAPFFSVVYAEEKPATSGPAGLRKEMACVWRRRQRRLVES